MGAKIGVIKIKRPILFVSFGFIIGIIWGLCINLCIVFIFILLYIFIYIIRKNKKIRRYFDLIFSKYLLIFIISAIISNFYIIFTDYKYNNLYKDVKGLNINGIIIEEMVPNDFYDRFVIKITHGKYEDTKLILKIKKESLDIKLGDLINVSGEYEEPTIQRNYKGFDYKQYLKTKKIYGTIKSDVNQIKIIKHNQISIIDLLANKVKNYIVFASNQMFPKEISGLLVGILIGDKENITEVIEEDFKNSSLSHMLAVSGTHVSYIILGLAIILNNFGKRYVNIFSILFLIFFMYITNFTASVVRACLMGIIMLCSKIFYRKSDIYVSMGLSILIILIENPFKILDIGLILSYCGTLGIVLLYKMWSSKMRSKNRIVQYVISTLLITFSAQLFVFPIIAFYFNNVSVTFFISNLLATPILAIIIILGFFNILIFFISNELGSILAVFLEINLKLLIFISHSCSNIPYSNLLIITPKMIWLLLYYFVISLYIIAVKVCYIKDEWQYLSAIEKKSILILKIIIKNKRRCIISIISILLIIPFINIILNNINKETKVYFIDVGQGDSTLITTENKKNILIDGGGNVTNKNYDVGENVLLPYLLDRGIKNIDYLFVSHFDFDHVGGLYEIIDKLTINKIIIPKNEIILEEEKVFIKKAQEKNIKIYRLSENDRIYIDKATRIHILAPLDKKIEENYMNNNSLVFKFIYKNFSILFTGDIEKIAEEKIINNISKSILKSDILKIPHHGSKTSTTEKFLEYVNPKIALIGVGKNNFGHPSDVVIERLERKGIKIYRTDLNGEIEIRVDDESKISVKSLIK